LVFPFTVGGGWLVEGGPWLIGDVAFSFYFISLPHQIHDDGKECADSKEQKLR
jgi:hypothetical protein